MTKNSDDKTLSQENKQFLDDAYRQHANTFRAWLLAFGVGLPIFVASNDKVWEQFSKSLFSKNIAYVFLSGVSLQILLSMVDKYADWFCLSVVHGRRHQDTFLAKFGAWWITNDWPSLLIDLSSIGLFVYATYQILEILSQ